MGNLKFKGSPVYLGNEGILRRIPLTDGCILTFESSHSKNTLIKVCTHNMQRKAPDSVVIFSNFDRLHTAQIAVLMFDPLM